MRSMQTSPTRRAALALAALLATAPQIARAAVQDYQIVRLLTYQTECRLARLENLSKADGPLRYRATCENLSFYPEGVEIACKDREDERSCEVLTRKKHFDQLELLRPR